MIMPTQVRITEERRRALLATTARAHVITAATLPVHSSTPRQAGRVRAGLRQTVASLIALAFVV